MKEIHIDRTDEEREELVKQWISQYWLIIVAAVLLAIGAVYGLNYMKQSKLGALNASATKTSAVNQALADNQLEKAAEQTQTLQSSEQNSSFAAVATLQLAKKYFDDKAYDKAISQYDWLIAQSGDAAMRDVARLRKARAEANAKQVEQALTTLSGLEGNSNSLEAALLKGDILMANRQFDEAKQAYESIQGDESFNPQLIKQRLDLIDIKQQVAQ